MLWPFVFPPGGGACGGSVAPQLLLAPCVASGEHSLPVESLLSFLSTCLRSHSTTVWNVARCCAEAAASVLAAQDGGQAASAVSGVVLCSRSWGCGLPLSPCCPALARLTDLPMDSELCSWCCR